MLAALLGLLSGMYTAMMAALVTMLIVFLFRKFLMKSWGLASGVLPWFSVGVGFVVGFYTASWLRASPGEVQISMLAGPIAGFLWDSLGKYFVKKE